jgi:hypothetical protein
MGSWVYIYLAILLLIYTRDFLFSNNPKVKLQNIPSWRHPEIIEPDGSWLRSVRLFKGGWLMSDGK